MGPPGPGRAAARAAGGAGSALGAGSAAGAVVAAGSGDAAGAGAAGSDAVAVGAVAVAEDSTRRRTGQRRWRGPPLPGPPGGQKGTPAPQPVPSQAPG